MNAAQQFLIEWAQDEFWIGHMLAMKVYDYGPDLEENISVGSISQDEMGHCRLLLRKLTQSDKQIDRFVYSQAPEEQRVSRLAECWHHNDWSQIVIKQLFYDYADETRMQFFRAIPDGNLQHGLEMMEREEEVHREHWLEWSKLLAESPIGKKQMQDAVNRMYTYLSDFFASPLYEAMMTEYGLSAETPEQLLNRTLDQIDSILTQLQLRVPSTREEMKQGLELHGGRYGYHSAEFNQYFDEITEVYRKNPDVVWS